MLPMYTNNSKIKLYVYFKVNFDDQYSDLAVVQKKRKRLILILVIIILNFIRNLIENTKNKMGAFAIAKSSFSLMNVMHFKIKLSINHYLIIYNYYK